MKNPYGLGNGESSSSSSLEREEEMNFMLEYFNDIPVREESCTSRKHRWVTPLSLATNIFLFLLLLFQLSQPCFFSARKCVYEKRGQEVDEQKPIGEVDHVRLMGDISGVVPECEYTSLSSTRKRMI